MLNPHLAITLARERERELRQARESVSAPRRASGQDDRDRRRADLRLSLHRRLRSSASHVCSESAAAAE